MESKGLLLRSGTIVGRDDHRGAEFDGRDSEMKQTQKGNNWHFGMKFHVGLTRAERSTA